MNKNLKIIFTYLKELFPDPETELHYSTPFQFVVAVMLSAQATDLQVNKVTGSLFEKIKTSEDLLLMGFAKFEKAISSINYYKTKAKHIFATAKTIQNALVHEGGEFRMQNEKYKDGIPDSVEELVKLPGIGIKTAKLIAHCVYGQLHIAVDTHIHRVSNRLGLVTTKTPEKTSELLEKIIPDSYKEHAHHALVLFGRYYCKAVKPRCEACKLQKICEYYRLKDGKIERLKGGKIERLKDGKIERLKDGKVERLKDGKIERLKDGKIETLKGGKIEILKYGKVSFLVYLCNNYVYISRAAMVNYFV